MRKKSFIAAASLFLALAVPATALAEPGGPGGSNLQAHFYDCTGPAGTPTSFDFPSERREGPAPSHAAQIRSCLAGTLSTGATDDRGQFRA